MKSQYSFVHNSSQHGYVLYLLFFRNPAQFILQCNGHFGFQESFLLFATHITNVLKLTEYVKFWNFDFGTTFGTLIHAQTLEFWGVFLSVSKTTVYGTDKLLYSTLNKQKVETAKKKSSDKSLTVSDICKTLGIGRTTFYRYVKAGERE